MLKTQSFILETQSKILRDSDETRQTISLLLDTQNRILKDIDALHGMFRKQHEDLGRFRGNYAESAMLKNRVDIARIFARPHGWRRIRFDI